MVKMLCNYYRWFLYIAVTFFFCTLTKCVNVVKHLNIKIASFVLDSIRVAHVLDLGYTTPSLRRSKAPLIHRSAAPPIKTITLSRMNTERSAFFLRVGLPFIPSLCFVKNWSLCCTLMWWNSYISNSVFFFFFPE